MAIKQKVPSPKEIKTTPQAFSQQELNEIKDLRDKVNQAKKLTTKYGKGSIDLETGTFTPLA